MNFVSLLLLVALCAISSVECGCESETRSINEPKSNEHVICTQFKNSDCLHCKANGNYIKCDTTPTKERDSKKTNGPIPNGLYAIGSVYTHVDSWANLYPQKKNGNGWWDYYRINPETGRGYIALHPGVSSLGCVTVKDRSCWNTIEQMLKSKNGDNITVSKSWWRSAKVKRVGLLRAVN